MRVVVSPSPLAAAEAAADAVAAHLTDAVGERGRAYLALSGGSTPRPMFVRLAAVGLPWQNIHIFQVDERAVPATDSARNWVNQQSLAERTPLTNRHPMPVENVDGDRVYGAELRTTMGRPVIFDVVHLGLGDDGHTASLFADDPALSDFDHDVAWTTAHRSHRRLTLTLPALARARHQVWLVAGAAKATAVRDLTSPGGSTPAAMVAAGADATLFADLEATGAVVG